MEILDPDQESESSPEAPEAAPIQERSTGPVAGGVAELRAAVRGGDVDACRALVEADPSLARARSARGGSLALEAHERELDEIAELLFSARKDGLDLDLHEAASLGRPNGVRHVLTTDPATLDQVGPAGFFPVHRAAYRGHVEALLFLLEAGADPRVRAQNGAALTPLHSAVAGLKRLKTGGRGLETIKLLLAAGADASAEMEGGWTPRSAADRDGLTEALALFDGHGSNAGDA